MLGRWLDDSFAPEVRADVTLLTVARLSGNSCYRYAAPFLATIARGLDVSLRQVGVALAVAELMGLMSPYLARLVDRLGQRRAMAGGMVGVAAGTALAGASQGVVMFAIALIVMQQCKVVFDIGLGSWIASRVPYDRRGVVVGLTETSWALGLLVGVSVMGLVTAATNWRLAYAFAAAGVLAVSAMVAARVPDAAPIAQHHVAAPAQRASIGRSGWLAVLGAMMLMASCQCLFVTFGGWLEDSFDFTPAALAAVTFFLGAGELASSITSARRTDRWGKERSAALGAGLMIPGSVALALWNGNLAIGLGLLMVVIVGFEFAIVSTLALASHLVPSSPARGLGLMIGAGTLGRALASIPATRLYERSGIAWPATMCAVLAACAVAAMWARTVQRQPAGAALQPR